MVGQEGVRLGGGDTEREDKGIKNCGGDEGEIHGVTEWKGDERIRGTKVRQALNLFSQKTAQ